jgi:hypothetical protein
MVLTAGITTNVDHFANWADFYAKNREDGGPFQVLSETNSAELARQTESHFRDINKLTETITGSDHGNMVLVPGSRGVMQLIHHGFACNTTTGFTLAFAHGNLGDCTTFKTADRGAMVAPAGRNAGEDDEPEGRPRILAPSLESMMGAESATEF